MYSYLHSYILNYDASQTEGCPVQAVPYRDCYLVACVFYGFVGLAVFLPVLLLDCIMYLPVIFGKYILFDLIWLEWRKREKKRPKTRFYKKKI